jgi:hypothetical protein
MPIQKRKLRSDVDLLQPRRSKEDVVSDTERITRLKLLITDVNVLRKQDTLPEHLALEITAWCEAEIERLSEAAVRETEGSGK